MKAFGINERLALQPVSHETADLIQDNGVAGCERIRIDRSTAEALREALGSWLSADMPLPEDEERVVVMLGDGDPPTVIFAVSAAAWDYCKDGKCHTFNLSSVGWPVQVMIAGGATREQIIADVQRGIESIGGSFERGMPDNDLGIKEPTRQ